MPRLVPDRLSEAVEATARHAFGLATEIPCGQRSSASRTMTTSWSAVVHHIAADGWSVPR